MDSTDHETPENDKRAQEYVSADAQYIAETAGDIKDELIVNMRRARAEEWRRWRIRRLTDVIIIVVAAYAAIWFHSLYIDKCIQTDWLSDTGAAVCKYVFWPWNNGVEPGPQYTDRIPEESSIDPSSLPWLWGRAVGDDPHSDH